ncbi:uncharacterized protein LOC135692559 [Rhopilema esculentum]|uniref:uncharacterized protein LOC135692559 n=1 Tax=Rhopilema esculentum TaxID=499914 RepID=UPI0031DF425D
MAGFGGCSRLVLQFARQPSVRLPLARRVLPIVSSSRNDGIFTKYREPPNGFLFNEKPLKPGEKRKWEDWEAVWYLGWGVSIFLVAITIMFKPKSEYLEDVKKEALQRIAELDAAESAIADGDE